MKGGTVLTGLDEDVFDADSTGSVRGECIEGYHAYGGKRDRE